MSTSPIFYSLLSVLLVSTVSLAGISLFMFHESLVRRMLLVFVGFSTGGLLGEVFLHILPEMVAGSGNITVGFLWILGGILGSFVVEKVIHWRHCHCSALPGHEDHIQPMGTMNLVGDGLHNFIDGALIAGSFLVSPSIGFATTIAVVLHEIPQEIGDFAVLLMSGFSARRALFFNFLFGCMAFLGAGIVLFTSRSLPWADEILLPLAAGNFLYLAGSDLIPELHKESRLPHAILQLVAILAGISVMSVLKIIG